MKRGRRSSLAGSPVLVGAATVLIALVAVVLAYNANSGLPFIKTYNIDVMVQNAKKLTTGNDVRIGGKRVGQVNQITAEKVDGGQRYVSRLGLSLDQTIAQLPVDSTFRIRPRSVIGQKFVEIVPGRSKKTYPVGATVPIKQTGAAVDFDDVTAIFQKNLRGAVRDVVTNLSTGFAGRGAQLNDAFGRFPRVLDGLTELMSTLSDPRTQLGRFITTFDTFSQAVLPVTGEIAPLLRGTRATFQAIVAERDAVAGTLVRAPSTLDELRRTSIAIRPVVRDIGSLTRELRPGVDQIPATVRALHQTVVRGVPVLRRTPTLARELESTVRTLDTQVNRRPSVADSLTLLKPTADSLNITAKTLVPMQTRCNYIGLFFRNLNSVFGTGDQNGNGFRFALLLSLPQMLQAGTPDPNLHYQAYPDSSPGKCAVGNESFSPGLKVGPSGGALATTNPRTPPPAGAPKGPR